MPRYCRALRRQMSERDSRPTLASECESNVSTDGLQRWFSPWLSGPSLQLKCCRDGQTPSFFEQMCGSEGVLTAAPLLGKHWMGFTPLQFGYFLHYCFVAYVLLGYT